MAKIVCKPFKTYQHLCISNAFCGIFMPKANANAYFCNALTTRKYLNKQPDKPVHVPYF